MRAFEAWQNSSPENQGLFPRTIRNRQLAVTRLIRQLADVKMQTQSRTSAFKKDPEEFLNHTLFDCGKGFDVSVIGAGINSQELLRNYKLSFSQVQGVESYDVPYPAANQQQQTPANTIV